MEKVMKTINKIFILIMVMGILTGTIYLTTALIYPSAQSTVVPTPTPTQTLSNIQYLQVFEEVWSTVNETFFDPEFGVWIGMQSTQIINRSSLQPRMTKRYTIF